MPDENMITAYPEKVDEYFKVNEVFIKKIPREIDCIQEIGNSQTRITSAYKYNEYLTNERNEAVISAVRPLIVKFASATKSCYR